MPPRRWAPQRLARRQLRETKWRCNNKEAGRSDEIEDLKLFRNIHFRAHSSPLRMPQHISIDCDRWRGEFIHSSYQNKSNNGRGQNETVVVAYPPFN